MVGKHFPIGIEKNPNQIPAKKVRKPEFRGILWNSVGILADFSTKQVIPPHPLTEINRDTPVSIHHHISPFVHHPIDPFVRLGKSTKIA
jgi:hypothetical protein